MEALLKILLKDPNSAIGIAQVYIEKYKPALYSICNEFLKVWSDYVSNDEHYELVAINKRKQYDAYMNVGFSSEQAMSLIINDNLNRVKAVKSLTDSVETATQK